MQEKKRTKRKEPQDNNKKTRYQMVIDGDVTPEGSEKGWKNLQPEKYDFNVIDPEKRKEICRKGAAAVNKMHGEKKTARQALESILTLKINDDILAGADIDPAMAERFKRDNPNATIYDLINAVAAGRALGGNIKAAEYIRDTYGDKPVDKVDISGEIMTDSDRAMLEKISRRLDDPGLVIAKDIT